MIEFEISAGLGVLRLNSPPVNAISLALLAKLQNAVRRANQEPEVRAIVITGFAGHFSAGADLADFQAIRTGDDAVRMLRTFQEAFQEIEDSEKVIIAAVAGHVLGGAWNWPCRAIIALRPRAAASVCRRSGWASIRCRRDPTFAPAGRPADGPEDVTDWRVHRCPTGPGRGPG